MWSSLWRNVSSQHRIECWMGSHLSEGAERSQCRLQVNWEIHRLAKFYIVKEESCSLTAAVRSYTIFMMDMKWHLTIIMPSPPKRHFALRWSEMAAASQFCCWYIHWQVTKTQGRWCRSQPLYKQRKAGARVKPNQQIMMKSTRLTSGYILSTVNLQCEGGRTQLNSSRAKQVAAHKPPRCR